MFPTVQTAAEKAMAIAIEKQILIRHEGGLARWAAPVKS